ncbi:hypothetical protein BDQ17DRAFT_447791 [Cyathus striatus]|nr:hypothetical protein BDQ17DRAFT_447791 [Cyathus striatus]
MFDDLDTCENRIPGLAEYYGYLNLSALESPFQPEDHGHTTVTRLLKDSTSHERSRSHTLLGPVGTHLEDHSGTNELVTALRDAVVDEPYSKRNTPVMLLLNYYYQGTSSPYRVESCIVMLVLETFLYQNNTVPCKDFFTISTTRRLSLAISWGSRTMTRSVLTLIRKK